MVSTSFDLCFSYAKSKWEVTYILSFFISNYLFLVVTLDKSNGFTAMFAIVLQQLSLDWSLQRWAIVSILELFWHLKILKSKDMDVWKLAAVPLEVPVSVLKDVLQPKILIEGGARKLTSNPSLVSRNKAVEEQGWVPMSNSLFCSC